MAVKQADAGATTEKGQGQQMNTGGRDQGERAPGGEQRRTDQGLARRDSPFFASPFTLLQRFFNDDITSFLDEFTGRRGLTRSSGRSGGSSAVAWAPKIDVVQRGNEMVVRADLPGVNSDDVAVEVSDDAITISGERRQEHTEEHGGVYRVERTYGSFFREIPLPEGAIADQAKAMFKDGVLEITVPAPPDQVARGRRVPIVREGETKSSEEKKGGTASS